MLIPNKLWISSQVKKTDKRSLEKIVHSLYFGGAVLTVLSLGIEFAVPVRDGTADLFYKLWWSGFSCSPWMVSSLMGQAFSTKLAGARRMVMMNGRLWLWQMYPNTLSRAPRPLSHTWSKFRPWTTRALLQSQLWSWDILEKTVSAWCYFMSIFPQQNRLIKVQVKAMSRGAEIGREDGRQPWFRSTFLHLNSLLHRK